MPSDDFPEIEELEIDTGLLDLTKLEGKPIELFGLKAAHLNGKSGRSLTWKADKMRMGVELDDGTKIAVKLENMRVIDVGDPPDVPAPTSPAASSSAPLYVGIVGDEFSELRPALEALGLATSVDASGGRSKAVASATVECIIKVTAAADVGAPAVAQALRALARVAPGAGREPLLRGGSGPAAAAAAMRAHPGDGEVQSAGLGLLGLLGGCGPEGVDAVLKAEGVGLATRAMRQHEGVLSVEHGACEMILAIAVATTEEEEEKQEAPLSAVPAPLANAAARGGGGAAAAGGGGGAGYNQPLWDAIETAGALKLLADAAKRHPAAGAMQTSACQLLARVAIGGARGQMQVCDAGGAAVAVSALQGGAESESRVRQAALFLLANLSSGDDSCREAVGRAGAPAALAHLISTYRAMDDVLRLTIGALSQLSQVEAGRKHVIDSEAPKAVILGIRAHASDPVVCHEACFFLAALVYGGPEGRRAAVDAGAEAVLQMICKRFKEKRSHEKTVAMAKTIVERLQQAITTGELRDSQRGVAAAATEVS